MFKARAHHKVIRTQSEECRYHYFSFPATNPINTTDPCTGQVNSEVKSSQFSLSPLHPTWSSGNVLRTPSRYRKKHCCKCSNGGCPCTPRCKRTTHQQTSRRGTSLSTGHRCKHRRWSSPRRSRKPLPRLKRRWHQSTRRQILGCSRCWDTGFGPRNEPPRSEQSASSTSWQVASLRQHIEWWTAGKRARACLAIARLDIHTDSATYVHKPLGRQHEPRGSHVTPRTQHPKQIKNAIGTSPSQSTTKIRRVDDIVVVRIGRKTDARRDVVEEVPHLEGR